MNILQLIKNPEGKTLEFKRDLSSPQPIVKTLVAFANTAGGRLFIGIDNDRQVIGVEYPSDEEERLCNIIADSISPRLVPNIEMITIDGKTVLVVKVFPSGSRPHYLTSSGFESGMRLRFVVYLSAAIPTIRPKHGGRSRAQSDELLEALQAGPLSSSELLVILGLKSKTGAFKRILKELLEQQRIEYTIPDKPKSRLQQYRLRK